MENVYPDKRSISSRKAKLRAGLSRESFLGFQMRFRNTEQPDKNSPTSKKKGNSYQILLFTNETVTPTESRTR